MAVLVLQKRLSFLAIHTSLESNHSLVEKEQDSNPKPFSAMSIAIPLSHIQSHLSTTRFDAAAAQWLTPLHLRAEF